MIEKLKKILRPVKRRVRLQLHRGDNYYCPICAYSSKDFSPIGVDTPVNKEKRVIGAGRRNAGCWKCNANDKTRLLYTYLIKKAKILEQNKKIKILHFAPESHLSKLFIDSGFINYTCGDLFEEGYHYPDYVNNIDVLNIPYKDDYFDLILCNHVLEHIPKDIEAMMELFRVLKNGGKAILQFPISKTLTETLEDFSVVDPSEREKVFGQWDHVRIYGQDYTKRLESAGFSVKRVNIYQEFPKYGLSKDEDIFLCTKG